MRIIITFSRFCSPLAPKIKLPTAFEGLKLVEYIQNCLPRWWRIEELRTMARDCSRHDANIRIAKATGVPPLKSWMLPPPFLLYAPWTRQVSRECDCLYWHCWLASAQVPLPIDKHEHCISSNSSNRHHLLKVKRTCTIIDICKARSSGDARW